MDPEVLLTELLADLPVFADKVPAGQARPVARVYLITGQDNTSDQPDWILRPHFAVDAWAETKKEASELAHQIRSRILTEPRNHTTTSGVIVYAAAAHPGYLPDPDWRLTTGEDGPRYTFTFRITCHPNRPVE